ncbi:TldD/PmbA family protein [bacterium]|nr:TldD/PmbA family protein [bacterium]
MYRVFSVIQEVVKKNSPEIEIEVFMTEINQTDIEVRDQQIEHFKLAKKNGVGLRIFHGGRLGFAYSSDISDDGLRKMAGMAMDNIKSTARDEYNGLAEIEQKHKMKDIKIKGIYSSDLKQVSIDDKINSVKEMEKVALAYDKKIKKVLHSSYIDAQSRVSIINSLGMEKSYWSTYCSIGISAVAEENAEVQVGSHGQERISFDGLNFDQVAKKAAQKAVAILGAKKVKSQRSTVVFPSQIACSFLEIISNAFCADMKQKGKSLFKDKIGKKVSSPLITIIDDGTLSGGIATIPFDDEGVPPQRRILINKGILEGYLYDIYTARKDNTQSTGNANRNSFAGLPTPSPTNFFIEEGKITKKELIEKVKNGLYVINVMGMHMVDPVSGDFSIGVEGLWIDQGVFSYPVRGITIAGNVLDLLNSIEEIGNDLVFHDNFGSPTLKISEICIGGE